MRNCYLCGVFRKRHKTFYLLNRFTNLHLEKDVIGAWIDSAVTDHQVEYEYCKDHTFTMRSTLYERNDPSYIFPAQIQIMFAD